MDANALVSAVLTQNPRSPPARIVERVLAGQVECVVSASLIEEYREVLSRDRVRRKHGLSPVEVERFVAKFVAQSRFVRPIEHEPEGPDPGDTHLWRLLRTCPGGLLITGDRPLLDNRPSWAAVASPREWLDRLSAELNDDSHGGHDD